MKTDKRDRAALFRRRLARAMQDAGVSQSALSRTVGVDRSTVSQLLAAGEPRLPNAQVAAECARALGVSSDWLLGLSDRPEQAAAIVAASLEISAAPRDRADQQIYDWHREAAGYKIRHVPARLPDLLKTPEMLRWEYTPNIARTTDQAIGATDDRLLLLQDTLSDYEMAIPLFELDSLIRGEGYYLGLPDDVRQGQIERFLELHDLLYPKVRIFLYDARRLHSAPITVFGPLLAALYLGQHYLVFRDTERITMLTRHFDALVREASVSARAFPRHILEVQRATA
jgi:transcriptional regulator with XRE-family HTH domain